MKTEQVKPKEEKIEKPKPQKFYQLFCKHGDFDMWGEFGGPQPGDAGKKYIEHIIDCWIGEKPEFKLISYEI